MVDKYYVKLFKKSLGTGKYLMFTFDIKESKKMSASKRYDAQIKIITLIERMYYDLLMLEEILKKEILIHDESYLNIFEYTKGDFAFKCEPFIFGDVVGLTIINNSIPPILIIDIFNMNKKELNIDFDFHIAYGNYETDDYVLGGELTFRGYVIHILSELHKDYFNNVKIP